MGRRKSVEEPESHERWLVSYADFITLLFAFFTVLYATADRNVRKQKEFEESFRGALQKIAQLGAGNGSDKYDVIDRKGTPITPSFPLFQPEQISTETLENDIKEHLRQQINPKEIEELSIEITSDDVGVRVQVASDPIFALGSTKLQKSATPILDRIARVLKKVSRPITIEGHVDPMSKEQLLKGKSGLVNKWDLSSGRASTVLRYFVKKHGMSEDLLSVAAYADQRPRVSNSSEVNRSKNRRIEFLFAAKREKLEAPEKVVE